MANHSYGTAIRSGFEFLLEKYPEFFIIGQGLWSPWYVGNSMTDLDKKFGKSRVIDTPVSEAACTGLAVGASLCGSMPVVVHPRIDFMLYAMDPIVNQAAKWSHMTGGSNNPGLTIRAIINRGGEQGAQHSQALHAWFAHIPGLRVVIPYSVKDARDLLVASVLCKDPVIYIDDKWLYSNEDDLEPIQALDLRDEGPKVIREGEDLTIVASGFCTDVALKVADNLLLNHKLRAEVVDLRVISPLKRAEIVNSVMKTSSLFVIDGGTRTAGFASEVITCVVEEIDLSKLKVKPFRFTLPDSPAPTSSVLEDNYYLNESNVSDKIFRILNEKSI